MNISDPYRPIFEKWILTRGLTQFSLSSSFPNFFTVATMAMPTRLNQQNPKHFSLVPSITRPPQRFSPSHTLTFSFRPSPILSLVSFHSEHPYVDLDEELVIGDCLIFEEGVFEDPNLQQGSNSGTNKPQLGNSKVEIEAENLIPEKWKQVQEAINITKKERRKLAQNMEFGHKVLKKRLGLKPIAEDYVAYRNTNLAELNPTVIENPSYSEKDYSRANVGKGEFGDSSGRVQPRNPKLAVYGVTLDDVAEFLNTDSYDPDAAQKSDGPRKLFSKEEKILLNKRVPDLRTATSERWKPLHTLAASGEIYLVGNLLRLNIDINATDTDGLTALHLAILGNKQAIFNLLLRESTNPFVRDKDGATLMHYAVRTASSNMIKILLLYNVNINLQDNDGWTPLHLAVQSRRTDTVKLLLKKGADKTLKNRDGLTPLDLCLHGGRDTRTYELIKILIKELPRSRSSRTF